MNHAYIRKVSSVKGIKKQSPSTHDVINHLYGMTQPHFEFYRHVAKVQLGQPSLLGKHEHLAADLRKPMPGAKEFLRFRHPHELASHMLDQRAGGAAGFMKAAGKAVYRGGKKVVQLAVKAYNKLGGIQGIQSKIQTVANIASTAGAVGQMFGMDDTIIGTLDTIGGVASGISGDIGAARQTYADIKRAGVQDQALTAARHSL
jgi:hypothetical protein